MVKSLRSPGEISYGQNQPLNRNFPSPILSTRDPTALDIGYDIGQLWVNTTRAKAFILTAVGGGAATWALASPGASDVDTINGLSPVAGNVIIAGGTNLTDVNGGNTVTLNLDAAITLATSVTSPLFTAAAADAVLQAGGVNDVILRLGDAAGATFLRVQDSALADVFTIDSNGVFGALAGLTVTGGFTQTAGAVSIGQDNAADAIDIGGGNVARAITLGSTGAHTIDIGSVAAGAIAIDSAAGISLDGATASNFTVTGAGLDLTLSSVGGSVLIDGSEASASAVNIDASDAAGGIDIDAGTGGITIDSTGAISVDGAAASNLSVSGAGVDLTLASAAGRVVVNGEEAAADAVRLLSAAGGLDANVALQMNLDSSQAAADSIRIVSSNVAGGIDIDSGTGGITVDSTGVLSIDSAGATNLTATGAFDVTVSSTAGSVIVSGGEGAADAVQITASDAAAGGVLITSGIGGIAANAVGAAAPITLDAVGVVEINSSGAAISVGNDANNFAVNVGTAGVRTVTVGSVTGASATAIRSGTGGITFTGNINQLDATFVSRTGDDITIQASPIMQSSLNTGVAPTGADGDVNLMMLQDGIIMEQFIIETATIIAPRFTANGLLISLDNTATEGAEYNFSAALANNRHAYTIGTSPAFFFEIGLRIADMDGANPYVIGFRKVEANNKVMADYTDYASIGMISGSSTTKVVTATELNAGGQTVTNTTDDWGGDGTTNLLRVSVDAAGNVSYLLNGVAPTVVAAFQFDNGDIVTPYIHTVQSATPGAVHITSLKAGFQP